MKKILILVTAILVSVALTAQENKVQKELKSYMMLSLGPSFPVGDYASVNENNDNSGYATTGVNIDLTYGYRFIPELAIEISGLYNFNGLDKKLTEGVTGAKVDHFQIIGFMAGPSFSNALNDKIDFGFRLRGGYATVNSPVFTYEGETLVTEDWAGDFIWSGGFNMKFSVSKKAFVSFNADYFQVKPEFNIEALGENINAEQRISVFNVNVGFGIRF